MGSAERTAWISAMSGTTTAKRRYWQRQLRRARSQGFYHALHGEITTMEPSGDRQVQLHIANAADGRSRQLNVDFLLDCTGMNPQLLDSPLLADLVNRGGAALNALGGLDVGPHFEVRGTRTEPAAGGLYASGAIARGGYLAPADSFLGFTYAALLICDDLAAQGVCRRLGTASSVAGWIKWLGRRTP
jgi:lysine/ornithine N-monooxygenase